MGLNSKLLIFITLLIVVLLFMNQREISFSKQKNKTVEAAVVEKEKTGDKIMENLNPKTAKATFAAGCFWGVQDLFDMQKGVVKSFAGYTGGHTNNPAYKDVCTGKTGHAEAVEVFYDPKISTYKQLLDVFFRLHDPTTLNRQGPDVGEQYRSVIFYHDEAQKKEALEFIAGLEKNKAFNRKIVTEVVPAKEFYKAEEYHQKYFVKNGQSGCHVLRK